MNENFPAYSSADEAKAESRSYFRSLTERASDLAAAALKALLILNGGAAIAMLGFVASVSGNDAFSSLELPEVISALQVYALGAAFAGLATGLGYAVLYMQAVLAVRRRFTDSPPFYGKGPKWRMAYRIYAVTHLLTLAAALTSFAAFLFGVWTTGNIFSATTAG